MGNEVYSGRHILQWHITHRCNLRCRHCYQADYACEMSPDALREALARYERFLKAEGLHAQINLTGGEPLAHPDFFSLAEEIRRHGHRFAVLTNGTMVDAEAARQLALLKPEFVQVSLDGTERVHDRIRGRGSFLRAAEGIDRLKARGVPVQVSFTAQRENRRSLPALALFCRAHGVDKLWFDRVVIPAEEDTGHLSLSGEEFRQLVRTARRLERFTPLRCVRSLQFADDAESGLYHCCAGGSLLILLADGTLMPCRRLPDVIGNIFDGELKDTLQNSETMRALRDGSLCRLCACRAVPRRRKMHHLCQNRQLGRPRPRLLALKKHPPGCFFNASSSSAPSSFEAKRKEMPSPGTSGAASAKLPQGARHRSIASVRRMLSCFFISGLFPFFVILFSRGERGSLTENVSFTRSPAHHPRLEFNKLTVSGISLHSSARLSDILRCKKARRS